MSRKEFEAERDKLIDEAVRRAYAYAFECAEDELFGRPIRTPHEWLASPSGPESVAACAQSHHRAKCPPRGAKHVDDDHDDCTGLRWRHVRRR